MFDGKELQSRASRYASLAHRADYVVVSSEDARNDLQKSLPSAAGKARVLHFVSSVPPAYWNFDETDHANLLTRYQLRRSYFYVPNQFWQHKNHGILLEAIRIAKERGLEFQIVCSGALSDPRSPNYFDEFQRRATEIGCETYLRILGIVPYQDVFALIRFSCAVINPSKFEGWSSTVEECKSVGKRMLLSDLPVHREQLPAAQFFHPDKPTELVDLIQATLSVDQPTSPNAQQILTANKRRFEKYGARYIEIVKEVCQQPSTSQASPT
jgi:glycosyltransferase involved in cell wall biosynthesis